MEDIAWRYNELLAENQVLKAELQALRDSRDLRNQTLLNPEEIVWWHQLDEKTYDHVNIYNEKNSDASNCLNIRPHVIANKVFLVRSR